MDRRAIARALTAIESGTATASELLRGHPLPARPAHRIGITGAPGAGKSTLTAVLVRRLRERGALVAVIAVDPSSPFSRGALLGDRLRMHEVAGDEGVFIRSMATRGALGGLSHAVAGGADVLEAAGFDTILIETVGVGQSEYEIMRAADTTLLVLTPESGDEVQMAKAGLMEIADVFVLNKADRPDSDALWAALRSMLDGRAHDAGPDNWRPAVVRTVASAGSGAEDVVQALLAHAGYERAHGGLSRRRLARLSGTAGIQ
ncbi:MAG: methylmalonyl Co-A mutase-associated GTPase MeaB [Steroidobacteraceae bacterium]